MGKRFGGWNIDTPLEKLEKLRELRNRKRNGPVIVSNINNKVSEENNPSTHEENS